MNSLIFRYKRTGLLYTSPIDDKKRMENELVITHFLSPHIQQLNECGGYIICKVERNGYTFHYQLAEVTHSFRNQALFKQWDKVLIRLGSKKDFSTLYQGILE